jgi:hypothetical protein
MIPAVATSKRLTASGLVCLGHCYLSGVIVGTDGINDPVVAVYDAVDASDATKRIIPSVAYDSFALGINGVTFQFIKECFTGLYVSISNLGSGEVVVDYRLN